MDYLQIYNEEFDATWRKFKDNIDEELTFALKYKKSTERIFNQKLRDLHSEYHKIEYNFEKDGFKSPSDIFYFRSTHCEKGIKNEEIIDSVLNNEVLLDFKSLNKQGYESFIKKLAEQQLKSSIHDHFWKNNKMYQSIYQQREYASFFIENFSIYDYDVSQEYIELLKSKFTVVQEQNKTETTSEEKKITTRQKITEDFNTQEIAILIHLLKTRLKPAELKRTHLLKLILIIGSTDNYKIFEVEKAADTYLYDRVKKGFSDYNKLELEKTITSLKMKLKKYKLNFIAGELNSIYLKYLDEKQ